MVKIILGFSSVILGASVGGLFANKYKKRLFFFKSLAQFNEDFYGELTFCKNNLLHVLSKKYPSAEFCQTLKAKSDSLINHSSFNLPPLYFLNENERYEIHSYLNSLGISDVEGQLKIVNAHSSIFKSRTEDCALENGKYGTLCKKTGIIAGLIAFIILI